MSLINQMLLDLERRRMSAQERSALPDHVRALPESERRFLPWHGLALVGLLAAAAAAGIAVSGKRWPGLQEVSQPVPTRTEGVREPATDTTRDGGQAEYERVAARLTFDLAAPPFSPDRGPDALPQFENAPLPASRIIDRKQDAAAPAPPERSTPVKPGPAPVAAPVPAIKAAPVPTVPERPPAAESAPAEIDIRVRKPTPQQLAEGEFARATGLLQQGRLPEAREALEGALRLAPAHHPARQTLLGLLINKKELANAEQLLQEGLKASPAQTGFAMALARLQVDRGEGDAAIETLQRSVGHAQGNAEFLAFHAVLLQRRQRHAEAVEYFDAALAINPRSGLWFLGKGVSLQALNRNAEAQDAYRRARSAGGLTPELLAFIDQRLRLLQ